MAGRGLNPMTDTKEKIEEELLKLVGIANGSRPGQVTHKLEEIKAFINKTIHSVLVEVAEGLGNKRSSITLSGKMEWFNKTSYLKVKLINKFMESERQEILDKASKFK